MNKFDRFCLCILISLLVISLCFSPVFLFKDLLIDYKDVITSLSSLIATIGGIVLLWKTFNEIKKSKNEIKDYLTKSKSDLILKKNEELPSLLLNLQYLLTNEDIISLPFEEKFNVENAKKELEFKINTILYAYSTLKAINLYTHFQNLLRTVPFEKEKHQIECLVTFYVLLAQIRYDIFNYNPDFSLFSITFPEYKNKIGEIKEYTLFLQKKYNLDDNFKDIFEKQS